MGRSSEQPASAKGLLLFGSRQHIARQSLARSDREQQERDRQQAAADIILQQEQALTDLNHYLLRAFRYYGRPSIAQLRQSSATLAADLYEIAQHVEDWCLGHHPILAQVHGQPELMLGQISNGLRLAAGQINKQQWLEVNNEDLHRQALTIQAQLGPVASDAGRLRSQILSFINNNIARKRLAGGSRSLLS